MERGPAPAPSFETGPGGSRPRWRKVAALVAIALAIVLVAAGVAIGFAFDAYRIPSPAMHPTLSVGDRVIADGSRSVRRGDVIVFRAPANAISPGGCAGPAFEPLDSLEDRGFCAHTSKQLTGTKFAQRVVAVGGDTVAMRRGVLHVNGRPERSPRPCRDEGACHFPEPLEVPAGHVITLGDNRAEAFDGRYWGPLPERAIRGRIVWRYWPPDRAGRL